MAQNLNPYLLSSWTLALLAGLTGSIHCVGMCGPIRLLVQGNSRNRWLYHGSRLLGYLLVANIAAAIGLALPLLAALVVVAIGLISLRFFPVSVYFSRVPVNYRAAALGLSSSLLPCGWLHYWILVALAFKSLWASALLVFILWFSSMMAMEFGITLLNPLMGPALRKYPKAISVALLLFALVPIFQRELPLWKQQLNRTFNSDSAKANDSTMAMPTCHSFAKKP